MYRLPRLSKLSSLQKSQARNARRLAAAVGRGLESLEARTLMSSNPVANPGGPYTVAEGSSITISGANSTDVGGTIASYKWDLNYNGSTFRTTCTSARLWTNTLRAL